MTFQFANLSGGRPSLRLPLSPLKAQMALKALESWREPAGEAAEKHWYRIGNQADGTTQINIFDEISWWGISAEQFAADLAAIDGPVEVHINSPGGDAFDGITIYNALAARPAVTTVVDGIAASAASLIAMAGRPRIVSPGGMLMIHDALALCIGNAAEMRDTATLLDKVSDNLAGIYAAHTGKPAAEWRKAMVNEAWYTAAEAVDAGLADQLAPRHGDGDPEGAWDRSVFAQWTGAAPPPGAPAPPGDGTGEEHPSWFDEALEGAQQ